jgi:hypothetical protein
MPAKQRSIFCGMLSWQSVELEESKRKCGWVRIDFDDFEGQ